MTEAATDERLILAIGRIEQAISRMERARIAPRAASTPAPSAEPDPALHDRHERLRETMREAIARIDRLIERQEG